MHLELIRPEIEQFVAEKVKAGDFPSPEAVVGEAIARMMREESTLTDEDVEAINQAEEDIVWGELVGFDSFAADMWKKYCK